MNFSEYQRKAKKTAVYPMEEWRGVYYTALGLAGEAGEVANKIKKHIRDGVCNFDDIADEIGDVLWYCAMLAHEIGYDLNTIAEGNVEKLLDRAGRYKIQGEGDKR